MFDLKKIEYGRIGTPEPVLAPAKSGASYLPGMALCLDAESHALVKASGDVTVTHVCLEAKTAAAGDTVLCYRVTPQMVFEAPLSVYDDTVVFGAALTIASDGLRVTATPASGLVATVGEDDAVTVTNTVGAIICDTQSAAAAGDRVLVRLA
ncbi:MAG: hypothetical protein J6125_00200 [Clostridia bacterium]|nr:hypothetical protein [Clostridia bacterium]